MIKESWSIVDFYERGMLKTKWMVAMNIDHVMIKANFWPDLQDLHNEEIQNATFWQVILFEVASKDGRPTKKLQFRVKKVVPFTMIFWVKVFFDPGRFECFAKLF